MKNFKMNVMKKGLLALLLITGLFVNKAAAQPCSLTNLQLNVYTGTDGKCYADFSFDMDRNNGNKYIYIHLWNDANYSLVNTSRWQKGAGPLKADIDGSTNSHPALATIAIDNNDYNHPVFSSLNYRPDATVTVKKGLTVTTSSTPVSGSGPKAFYRYTVTKVLLANTVNGGCTSSNISGIVWSTQANSTNSHIHCSLIGATPARTLDISGSANCGTKSYTLNIDNNTNNAISGSYFVYADNGVSVNNGIFDPNTDTQIDNGGISVGKNQTLTFTRTIPDAYLGYNLWAQIILSDNTTQVIQLTTTPCAAVPDLTPRINLNPNNIIGTSTMEITVQVNEINNAPTNGSLITLYVDKQTMFSNFSFNSAQTTNAAGQPIQNSQFSIDATSNPDFYVITTNAVFMNSLRRVTFSVTVSPGQTKGSTPINVFLKNGSGGETNFTNNSNFTILTFSF